MRKGKTNRRKDTMFDTFFVEGRLLIYFMSLLLLSPKEFVRMKLRIFDLAGRGHVYQGLLYS